LPATAKGFGKAVFERCLNGTFIIGLKNSFQTALFWVQENSLIITQSGRAEMAKKKKSGFEAIAVLIGLVVLVLAAIPKEVWIALGFGVAAYLAIRLFSNGKEKESANPTPTPPPQSQSYSRPVLNEAAAPVRNDEPVSTGPIGSTTSSFKVPTAPQGYGPAVWSLSEESLTVADVRIPRSMLYVGSVLKTIRGDIDPCLVDPSKGVASQGDFTERQTDYWPSYSRISESARRAYLNWLADGKKHPEADVGYVFLYFYGLERRAILDTSRDPAAKADLPAIAKELRRLLGIYGEKSHSFRNYASELLGFAELTALTSDIYNLPVPDFPHAFELPGYLRLALGQVAVAGVPLPRHLALAWVRLDPNTRLRTPATRCAAEFEKLFAQKYEKAFGAGMVLPKNKTKLKIVYRPASSGFQGAGEIKLTFGETPDVTVLTAPISKLRLLAEEATKELESYSRLMGRNQGTNPPLEALLQLPVAIWPDSSVTPLKYIKSRNKTVRMVKTLTFDDLLAMFESKTALSREKVQGFVRVLESMNIAMEPDVLGGIPTPKPSDKVVLFAIQPGEPTVRSTPAYQAALLTLQLASGVAAADGEFSEQEVAHLQEQVKSWNHLTPNHQLRLMAHLKLLVSTPVSLTSLKKKLEPLAVLAKEAIATFMATVAQADGTVSPAEIKMLEKVYKVLGVDPKKVFSDVHAAAAGTSAATPGAGPSQSGFKLDTARIAALQEDSARVSALLAGIFKEDEVPVAPVAAVIEEPSEESTEAEGVLGLDEAHSSFARMLLSRPQWSRAELLDMAEDLELMLDGALERINEASFDAFDSPLTEGDDPIEVNAEVFEKVST
jgi:uncharacterized tellurite resistance protein B-like protein